MRQEYRLLYADWDGAVAVTGQEVRLRALLEEYVRQGDNLFELELYEDEGEGTEEHQVGRGAYEVGVQGIEVVEEETGKLRGVMQRIFGEDRKKAWIVGGPPELTVPRWF